MKRTICILLTTSAASLCGFTTQADDTSAGVKTDKPNYSSDRLPDGRRMHRLNDAAKASDLIGMTVKNYQDEKLGKVDDLAVDMESGRVVQVILSTGGFIGIGDRLSAVPPGALHHDVVQKVVHLNVDKEKLKNAPVFEMSKWSDYSDSAHLTEVYRYYGEEPSLKFIHNGETVVETRRTTDDVARGDNHFMIPSARLSHLQRASKIIGTAVQNLQDEKLGKVDNLLIDLPSGRVVAAVVSSGGFLGMGDELSAVPPSAFRFTTDRHMLQLDTTKEALATAPHFKAHQWPDFAEPTYTEGVYRAYNVRPYFRNDGRPDVDGTARIVRDPNDPTLKDTSKDVDNTAQNVRDRNDRTLTPLDQGKSESDRKMTADIRKAIVADKALSVNARNVKIITINGQVTLRGPVNTSDERSRIGDIAGRIAGTTTVNNQLEVKSRANTGSNN